MKLLLFSNISIALLFSILLHEINTAKAFAFTAQGDNYIFHMNINNNPEEENLLYNKKKEFIKNYTIPTPIPYKETHQKKFEKQKTEIKIGYTNVIPKEDFQFLISDTTINFGIISPTDFITRKLELSIHGDPSYLYTIMGYADHELKNEANQIIPNTTCDDGKCNDTIATAWKDTLTFGFGYRCNNNVGKDCDSSFKDKDSFKKISVADSNENGKTLIRGNTLLEKRSDIIYKVNASGTQQKGNYQNNITYLALPMY